MLRFSVISSVIFLAGALHASPGSDVREGVERLKSEPNYAWVVATSTERTAPASVGRPLPSRRNPERVIATGRQDRESVAIVTMRNPLLNADVSAVRMAAIRAVAQTPLGWMTSEDIQRTFREHADEEVRFEGRTVRLFQWLSAARMVLEQEPPEQELARLLTDLGGFAGTREEITGQLTPAGALAAMYGPSVRRSITNHTLEGTVTFRFRGARLVEYEINIAGKVQPPDAPEERETNHRQTTRLSGFGATMVVAPPDAFARLIR